MNRNICNVHSLKMNVGQGGDAYTHDNNGQGVIFIHLIILIYLISPRPPRFSLNVPDNRLGPIVQYSLLWKTHQFYRQLGHTFTSSEQRVVHIYPL